MHEGMGGPHEFLVPLETNAGQRRLLVRSDWGP